MPYIKHDVPLVAQRRDMSCWYAAVVMIGNYYEAGPRQGLPNIWISNEGIADNEIQALAQRESLLWLKASTHDYTVNSLAHDLNKFGPMFSICRMPQGKHVLVITGASDINNDGEVLYNDPDGGVATSMPITEWNTRRHRGYLLVRSESSFPDGFFFRTETINMY